MTCLCSEMEPFDPGVQLVFLMHRKEAQKQRLGTGRVAHLMLKGSRLLRGVDFSGRIEIDRLVADPALWPAVLYPAPGARDLSREGLPEALLGGRRPCIFVPDGTWSCVPQCLSRSSNLRGLPLLTLTPPFRSTFKIKRQPFPEGLATIEAVYCLLGELERLGLAQCEGRQQRLLEVFRRMVEIQIAYASGGNNTRHQAAREARRARGAGSSRQPASEPPTPGASSRPAAARPALAP